MSLPAPLDAAGRIAWLRLARSEGVGPVTFFGLLARFVTPQAALEALPGLAARTGRKAIRIAGEDAARAELAAVEAAGGQLLCAGEPGYPAALAALAPPPPVLTVRGHGALMQRPCVALVGARNASGAGLRMARDLARDLGAAGWVVVSGLARGIDGAAHRESLPTGTIAVLAGGIDHIYPPEHEGLHGEIAERGLLASENPMGAIVHARDFPRRNRIISGLSRGVVVVEAEARSGSLITARMALEQGRDVMAVPGSPLDPRAAGPNGLIRDGARLVTSAADVIETLSSLPQLREPSGPPPGGDGPAIDPAPAVLEMIAGLLSPVPVSLDLLARETGLPWRTVAAAVVELELSGIARTGPGGGVVRE